MPKDDIDYYTQQMSSTTLPDNLIENVYKRLEKLERKSFEQSSWDKFFPDIHGSPELRFLKRHIESQTY